MEDGKKLFVGMGLIIVLSLIAIILLLCFEIPIWSS